jgi:phage gpG-like protein
MAEILSVDVSDGDVIGQLERAANALTDLTELYSLMGAVMERNINLRFETKTDPNGAAWAPLAESTKASYLKKYDGIIPGSLLERSGHGRASLGSNVSPSYLEVGFAEVYMGYQETGNKKGTLPARSMLLGDWQTGTLGEGDRVDLVNEIEDFLSQQL